MKEVTEYQRFCEWKPKIYFINSTLMDNALSERLENIAVWANEPLDMEEIYRFLATNTYVQGLIRSINTIL